jgi:hypothetical protein
MTFAQLCQWLEAQPLPTAIRDSPILFPWIESVHVMAATFVVGALIVLDLRLVGAFSRDQPVSRMTERLTPWIWGGFCVSLATGALLFSQTAEKYYLNTMFRAKMSLLLLAALNMLLFHFVTYRKVATWDDALSPPVSVRAAGLVSLGVWTAVIVVGRWIGFTLE